jgi:hypothetical protein
LEEFKTVLGHRNVKPDSEARLNKFSTVGILVTLPAWNKEGAQTLSNSVIAMALRSHSNYNVLNKVSAITKSTDREPRPF